MWQRPFLNLRHKYPYTAEVFFMAAEGLKCKECQTEYPLDARYVCERCFGPLEVAYAPPAGDLDVDALRRRIQARPLNIWRYADFLPVDSPPTSGIAPGFTPLIRADRLAE